MSTNAPRNFKNEKPLAEMYPKFAPTPAPPRSMPTDSSWRFITNPPTNLTGCNIQEVPTKWIEVEKDSGKPTGRVFE